MKETYNSIKNESSTPQSTSSHSSQTPTEPINPTLNAPLREVGFNRMPYALQIIYYSLLIIFNLAYGLVFDYNNTLNELRGSPSQDTEENNQISTPDSVFSSPSTPEDNIRGNYSSESPPQRLNPLRLDFGEEHNSCYLS